MSTGKGAKRLRNPKSIDEIAAATGFSRTTVRFVVTGQTGKYRIKQETKETIESYIREHGIVINHAARSLRLKRSDAVGLVLPDLDNPFFAALTSELEELCRQNGKVLLTGLSHDDPRHEARAVDQLLERGIDGLVVAPCSADTVQRPLDMGGRCAVVFVDRAFPASPYPVVVSDNRNAAQILTRRIINESGGDIEFLCAVPDLPSVADRIEGFVAACKDEGIGTPESRLHFSAADTIEAGARLTAELLGSRPRPPRALMTSSLLIFQGCLRQISADTGQPPRDLILGTFDNTPLFDFFASRILSIQQNERAIAGRVFRCLAEQMEGAPPFGEQVVVPGTLKIHPGLFVSRQGA